MTGIVVNRGELSTRKIANTIDSNYYKGIDNHGQRTGLIEVTRISGHEERQTGRIYDSKGLARTMCSGTGGMGKNTGLYEIKERVRRLTPLECERLQGFPDGWTEGISDTQRYKCLGNAVMVPCVQYIASHLTFGAPSQ